MENIFTPSSYYYRESLFHQLDSHNSQSLIGLFASSGFGKSTFVRSYLDRYHYDHIWITAEQLERRRSSLLSYLCVKAAAYGYDDTQYPDIFSWLDSLSSPLYLVIDHYHLIDSLLGVNGELLSLVENESPYLKIIIIGNSYPSLPLSRLKAKKIYFGFDDEDLAYSRYEIEEYFNHYCNLDLKPYELDAIYDTTAGWPAGCQLILDFIHKNPEKNILPLNFEFFASIPDLFDYLSSEVFSAEPDEIKEFMLYTSLFTDLDPDIIDAFLGIQNSKDILLDLAQSNSFLHKNEYGVFQYHKLYRSFLYNKFKTEHANILSQQHGKLASIYFDHYSYISAFSHAVAGNDYVMATKVMRVISDRYNPIQFINVIDGHLEEVSSDLQFSHTSLFLTRCIPEKILREFILPLNEVIRSSEKEQNDIKTANLQNRLGTIYFHLGEVDRAEALFVRSCKYAVELNEPSLLICNLQILADCYLFMGQIDRGLECAKRALFLAEKHHVIGMQIHTLEVMSRLHIALNDDLKAEMYLTQAMGLAADEPFLSLWLLTVKSTLLQRKGQMQESIEMAQKAVDSVKEYSDGFDIAYSYLTLANAYRSAGNSPEAEKCYEIAHLHAAQCGAQLYTTLLHQHDFYSACGKDELAAQKKEEIVKICKKYRYSWSPYYSATLPVIEPDMTDDKITIRTLGGFEVLHGNSLIRINRSSSIALLQFLIVNRGKKVNKDVIIDNIFPYDGSDNTNHFNVALSVLRKRLEPEIKSGKDSKYILRHKQSYTLNEDTVSIDVDEFFTVCETIMNQADVIDPALVTRFHELYRGTFFEDYPYETFLDIERERINRQYIEVLLHLAQYYRNSETPAKSIEYYDRVLKIELYDEKIYLDYIELLLSLSASKKATDIADQMIAHLEGELNVPVHKRIKTLFKKHNYTYIAN